MSTQGLHRSLSTGWCPLPVNQRYGALARMIGRYSFPTPPVGEARTYSADLSAVTENNFVAEVDPLIRNTSFSLGFHQFSEPDLSRRLSLSISTAVGNDLTDRSFSGSSIIGLPIIHGELLVTENLKINVILED